MGTDGDAMSVIEKVTTVGGTIACAFGIGYFMQQGGAPENTAPIVAPKTVDTALLDQAEPRDATVLEIEQITLTSAPTEEDIEPAEFQVASLMPIELPSIGEKPETPETACTVTAVAEPGKMAGVTLSLNAPCFGNERVTFHHNGLMFSDTTDADGQLEVMVPALSQRAVFIMEFANGRGAVAVADVPTLEDFDRIVLQWVGKSGFQVHAREFGASYGEKGHVWSGSAHLEGAETDRLRHGFVTRLGDPGTLAPRLAEVYSFPTGMANLSGSIQLSVEAEVTDTNCGRDISAQILDRRRGKGLHTDDLVLAMPECSKVGEFLVLNNVVDDLMIASK